jgi:hypothetical protein
VEREALVPGSPRGERGQPNRGPATGRPACDATIRFIASAVGVVIARAERARRAAAARQGTTS